MNRINMPKLRKSTAYPWIVRRHKDRIIIEIVRKPIRVKGKVVSTVPPDCKPEIW